MKKVVGNTRHHILPEQVSHWLYLLLFKRLAMFELTSQTHSLNEISNRFPIPELPLDGACKVNELGTEVIWEPCQTTFEV